MFINSEKSVVILFFFFAQFAYTQTDHVFEQYLDGDYHSLTSSSFKVNSIYLASAHTHLDEYDKAEALFFLVKKEDKKTALYLNEKGFLLLKMYQLDQAKLNFEETLKLNPDYIQAKDMIKYIENN